MCPFVVVNPVLGTKNVSAYVPATPFGFAPKLSNVQVPAKDNLKAASVSCGLTKLNLHVLALLPTIGYIAFILPHNPALFN